MLFVHPLRSLRDEDNWVNGVTFLHFLITNWTLFVRDKLWTGTLPEGANAFYIVGDLYLRNIYQIDAVTGTTRQLLPFGAASSIIAVAYDPTSQVVYWSQARTIRRYSLLTRTMTTVYTDPNNTGIFQHFVSRSYDTCSQELQTRWTNDRRGWCEGIENLVGSGGKASVGAWKDDLPNSWSSFVARILYVSILCKLEGPSL